MDFLDEIKKKYGFTKDEIDTILDFLDTYWWDITEENGLYNIYDQQCNVYDFDNYESIEVVFERLFNKIFCYYMYEIEFEDYADEEDKEYSKFLELTFKDILSIGEKANLLDDEDKSILQESIEIVGEK